MPAATARRSSRPPPPRSARAVSRARSRTSRAAQASASAPCTATSRRRTRSSPRSPRRISTRLADTVEAALDGDGDPWDGVRRRAVALRRVGRRTSRGARSSPGDPSASRPPPRGQQRLATATGDAHRRAPRRPARCAPMRRRGRQDDHVRLRPRRAAPSGPAPRWTGGATSPSRWTGSAPGDLVAAPAERVRSSTAGTLHFAAPGRLRADRARLPPGPSRRSCCSAARPRSRAASPWHSRGRGAAPASSSRRCSLQFSLRTSDGGDARTSSSRSRRRCCGRGSRCSRCSCSGPCAPPVRES